MVSWKDEAFPIIDRDVTISGLLVDGSDFSFDLNTVREPGEDLFAASAEVFFTVVQPEILVGDCNRDGVVNFLDIPPFVQTVSTGEFRAEADINQDGEVDFLDIFPFVAILTS